MEGGTRPNKESPLKTKSYSFGVQIVKLRADFRNKMSIALKEANETEYWLSILRDTDYITEKIFRSLSVDCVEFTKMLIATVKTTKVA